MWTGRVERQFEAAHSNGPPGQQCYIVHGHSWQVAIEWTYKEVNEYGWGPDFGAVKKMIDGFDHKNLNELFDRPSAEYISQYLYRQFANIFGFDPDFVQLSEGKGNTVVYREP